MPFFLIITNYILISSELCFPESGNETTKIEPLFKKARVGVANSLPYKSTLEKLVESSPFIEELELWKCR